ncbi:hypothetical protein C8J57DRAFT_733986 [Mycena rebaudengoi]|nr:hypothetical protein C8J57DRAFT_733986 [Mycena rebaudengoi]
MSPIVLVRLVVMCIALGFSAIVLGLAAGLTATTEKFLSGYFEFAALAIATAIITLVTVSVMVGLEFMRLGGFTSMVAVEIGWLSILWVLWLATGAESARAGMFTFIVGCDYGNDVVNGACRETSAIQAFSFLTWIILLGYTITLLIFSLIAQSRKNPVWTASVAEAPFFSGSAEPTIPMAATQPSHVQAGSYTTGPASVQAGTVHQAV